MDEPPSADPRNPMDVSIDMNLSLSQYNPNWVTMFLYLNCGDIITS